MVDGDAEETSGQGCLYGVGVGPGDPELLTLKAVRVIRNARVVIAPRSESGRESLAMSVARAYVDSRRQCVLDAPFPTARSTNAGSIWERAVDDVVRCVYQGDSVAFLTLGDPLLYGSFGYVMERVQKVHPQVSVKVVPGVSSLTAAAASATTPLVGHGQRMLTVPGIYSQDDLGDALEACDTLVVMKVNEAVLEAARALEQDGRASRTLFVRRATMPEEKVVRRLQDVSTEDVDYFSLLVIQK